MPDPRPAAVVSGCAGAAAFKMFQAEMGVLLRELKARGTPDPDDQDIATQLCRVSQQGGASCMFGWWQCDGQLAYIGIASWCCVKSAHVQATQCKERV
jgi:hypothetical protein